MIGFRQERSCIKKLMDVCIRHCLYEKILGVNVVFTPILCVQSLDKGYTLAQEVLDQWASGQSESYFEEVAAGEEAGTGKRTKAD